MNKQTCITEDTLVRDVMTDWTSVLKTNPIPQLLEHDEPGLVNRVCRDLLENANEKFEEPVCDDITYKSLARRQKPDGSWRESGSKKNEDVWTFFATLRSLYLLLDLGADMSDELFLHGAHFIAATQSLEGDFRGAYGVDIPAPDYTGMVLDVLLRGGFDDEKVIDKAFDWLLDVRRANGGWAIPGLRSKSKKDASSHNVTGMVLRGFAADSEKRHKADADKAAAFLADSIFKPDSYPDRRAIEYWGKISYPFWFTDALSAIDVLSRLGFDLSFGRISRAHEWLLRQQGEDGFWSVEQSRRDRNPDPWLTFAALRTIKAFVR